MFMVVEIAKKRNEVPHGISMETNRYEDKIKSIEIPRFKISKLLALEFRPCNMGLMSRNRGMSPPSEVLIKFLYNFRFYMY